MTYRINSFTVATSTETIKLRHDGKDYNASVSRAVHQSGKLCFVLRYEFRDWCPPIFGTRDYFFVLDTKHKQIAKGVHLHEALAAAEGSL
jgi:hypothetical protein